jgi:hypothetical protein
MKTALIVLLMLIQPSLSYRFLDVYAKDAHDVTYLEQLRLLNADPRGMKERDVVIRQHFGASRFRITLTGKDGGEKYQSNKILTQGKLFAIIDAMPMRREEMRKQ